MRPGDERAGVMMMMIIQNNTLPERAQGWEGCELWCHYESRDAAPTLYTDHSYVETHIPTLISVSWSLSNIQKIAAPDPRISAHIFPCRSRALFSPGESRHRDTPPHTEDGENILRDKDATRDSQICDIWRARQRHGAVTEIRLSHSAEESHEKVDSSGDRLRVCHQAAQ